MNLQFRKKARTERIAVIGGGIMGISVAMAIRQLVDTAVTLFEKNGSIGGLSGSYTWNGTTWDRFYHVVLSTDTTTLDFIQAIRLSHELTWVTTKSGFYRDHKLVPMSTVKDFLSFPFLSLWQKVRLAIGIILSTHMKNVGKLDRIYVREWLTKLFGRRVFERIWDPLLRSKLGASREMTSAAFIWATIKRLYGSRRGSEKIERMGYVHGGYARILEQAHQVLAGIGVDIFVNHEVTSIASSFADEKPIFIVKTDSSESTFDKVVLTVPSPEIMRIVQRDQNAYWERLSEVSYLGVICVLLILRRALSEYYVINLLDSSLPFTGIIEATNVVSPSELHDTHFVYLPKYAPAEDPLWNCEDREIVETFCDHLRKVFSDLNSGDILHAVVFREKYVQPLQKVRFLDHRIGFRSPVAGLYVVNTSMIYNSTINNNAVITLARDAAHEIVCGNQ